MPRESDDHLSDFCKLARLLTCALVIAAVPAAAQDIRRHDAPVTRAPVTREGIPVTRERVPVTREGAPVTRERDHGGEVGIGIGVGGRILRELSRPPQPVVVAPADAPAVRNTRKIEPKKKAVRAEPVGKDKTPVVRFVGKPDQVPHDPNHHDGKLGDLNDHKQLVVSKDGSYFTRHYYYTRTGEQRTWFYYDVPLDGKNIAKLKDVPNCRESDDDCDEPPPVINVDDKPPELPSDVAKLYENPCENGELIAGRAYSICVANKDGNSTWHVRSDDAYMCPDGTTKTYRTVDTDTGTPCSGARPATTGIAMKLEQDAKCTPLQNTNPLRFFESWECVGQRWRVTRYDIKTCTPPDSRRFIGPASTPPPPNPNTDAGACDANSKTEQPPTGNPEMKKNDVGKGPI